MIQASLSPYSSVLSSNGYCNICYNSYDLLEHKPLLVCPNDHSVCKQCLLSMKRRLRCPFCRGQVKLNRIRLNKQAVRQIQMKSRGISPSLSPHVSRNINRNKIGDRLITQNTNERNIQEEHSYLDQAEFSGGSSLVESSSIIQRCNEEILLTFLLLIGLQLPLGVLDLLVAVKEPSRDCFDCLMPGSIISLRTFWRATAIVDILVALLSILLLITYCFELIPNRWQGIPILSLMFALQINCIMSLIVYLNLMASEVLPQYSQPVRVVFTTNVIVSIGTLILELFLIGRYPHNYLQR